MTPSAFVAAFNSPDAPCPVCGVALGSSMMHEPPECIAVLRRHLSESEARARVAEGAYQQMRGECVAAELRGMARVAAYLRERSAGLMRAAEKCGDGSPVGESAALKGFALAEAAKKIEEGIAREPVTVLPVTPALRAAVEAVREADKNAAALEIEIQGKGIEVVQQEHLARGVVVNSATIVMPCMNARAKLVEIILSALPPVKP